MANFCKNCGCAVSSTQKYCSNCGEALDSNTASANNTSTSSTTYNNGGNLFGTLLGIGILSSLFHPFCHHHHFGGPFIGGPHGPFGGPHGGFGGPHGGGFGGHGGFGGGHH